MGQPSCHPAVTPLSPRRHIAVRGSPFPRTLAASPTTTPATAWRSGTSCIVIVCCANVGNRIATMVDIAQQVEHLIVVQKVARSNRVIHPSRNPYSRKACRGFLMHSPLPNSPTCVPHVCPMRIPTTCTPRCAAEVRHCFTEREPGPGFTYNPREYALVTKTTPRDSPTKSASANISSPPYGRYRTHTHRYQTITNSGNRNHMTDPTPSSATPPEDHPRGVACQAGYMSVIDTCS